MPRSQKYPNCVLHNHYKMVLETEESGLFFCYCFYPFIIRDVRATVTKSVRTMDSAIRNKGDTMVSQAGG